MTTKSIRIYPENYHYLDSEKPKSRSMTAHINMILENRKKGLDTCDTLKIPKEKQPDTQGVEGFSSNTRRVSNSINKENSKKRFLFKKDLIPFDLSNYTEKIEQFWKVKTGVKSEASFNLLIKNLSELHKTYGEKIVIDQIDLAIAGGPKGPWSNITVRNYDIYRLRNNQKAEPAQTGQAHRVFTAAGGFE